MRDIPYDMYIRALVCSRTGKKLLRMLPVPIDDVTVVNASPKIGMKAQDSYAADVEYLQECVNSVQPDKVITFGKVAHEGMYIIGIEHYVVPHPANRTLSNVDILRINAELKEYIS